MKKTIKDKKFVAFEAGDDLREAMEAAAKDSGVRQRAAWIRATLTRVLKETGYLPDQTPGART